MYYNEIATISATFAPQTWINPRNGEERLYINNLFQGCARVFITRTEDGGFEVHQNTRDAYNWDNDMAYEAVDNALKNANLPLNSSFDQIIETLSSPVENIACEAVTNNAISIFIDEIISEMNKYESYEINRVGVVEEVFRSFAEGGDCHYEISGSKRRCGCPLVVSSQEAYDLYQSLETCDMRDI